MSPLSQTQHKPSVRLAEAAQALVGIPYQRQGRTVAGVDCVGLVVVAAQAVGFDLSEHDTTDYGRFPSAADLRTRLDASLADADELEAGCIVLMNAPELGAVHVGIVAQRNGTPTLVHAVDKRGCVVEHRLDSHLRSAIEKTYILKDA